MRVYLVWLICLGPSCAFCHVVPSLELSKVLEKPTAQELEFIEKVPIGKTPRFVLEWFLIASSRLACQVPVTKEMNGGVFFVGFRKGVICADSSPCPERAPLRDCRQQFILKFINVNVFVVYSRANRVGKHTKYRVSLARRSKPHTGYFSTIKPDQHQYCCALSMIRIPYCNVFVVAITRSRRVFTQEMRAIFF